MRTMKVYDHQPAAKKPTKKENGSVGHDGFARIRFRLLCRHRHWES